MATVVLTELIYMMFEMYIDDCTVFGDTNIEFVSRLKLIFERFRKHNLEKEKEKGKRIKDFLIFLIIAVLISLYPPLHD